MTVKVAVLGECMLELSNAEAGHISRAMPCRFNFGGDTLNSAVYMARLGLQVSYFTALGDDVYSQWLINEWASEDVDTSQVVIMPKAMPGLYMIQTDDHGERSFSYWRDQSAARQWLHDEAALRDVLEALKSYNVLYISGITLSLMGEAYFEGFVTGLQRLVAQGLKVVFDINYRPRGWANESHAKKRIESILRLSSMALPTFDDEMLLFRDQTPQQTAERYKTYGVQECVIKLGAEGALCIEHDYEDLVPTEKVAKVIDSTGAGDSFNGAYLAKRLAGASMQDACLAGHCLAGKVIQYRGAIIELKEMPEFL